jgi:hypothetical protein
MSEGSDSSDLTDNLRKSGCSWETGTGGGPGYGDPECTLEPGVAGVFTTLLML